jgi:hypothetical protein
MAQDQAVRKALAASPDSKDALNAALKVDADGRDWFRRVLEACNWPARSSVGEQAALGAWLIAQHGDMDPDFQVFAAEKMKAAVMEGEASGTQLASLVDRHRRLQGLPQVYGMQFDIENGQRIVFLPIEMPERLEARRRDIGIEPFVCRISRVAHANKLPATWPQGVAYEPAACADSE